MMQITKKQITNIILIVCIILFLFTPIGFHIKVYANRLLSLTPFVTPTLLADDEQVFLESYRWKMTDIQGKPFEFENEKGNVIIINFWATWCPPCVAEMPSFQKLYHSYGDKVTFLFVASDEIEKVNTFLTKKGYTFPVYFTYNNTPKKIESPTIPTTYLISKSGKIVMKKTMVADWNSKEMISMLDTLLKE